MFGIGVLVGVIILLDVLLVGLMAAIYGLFGGWDNFWNACEILVIAIKNRETKVEIWHDGERTDVILFEKK